MNGLTPDQGVEETSSDRTTELELHIQSRLGGLIREFRLVVVNGGLILRGRTYTYYAKQIAQHEVMQGSTLPILANEIEVC
jgi:hypothetical protein